MGRHGDREQGNDKDFSASRSLRVNLLPQLLDISTIDGWVKFFVPETSNRRSRPEACTSRMLNSVGLTRALSATLLNAVDMNQQPAQWVQLV